MNVQSNVKATHTVEQKWSNVMRKGKKANVPEYLCPHTPHYTQTYVRI